LPLSSGAAARDSANAEDALFFVLGYTCLNDVTARDLQKSDVQFTRGKGFDTFCPVGPHIETALDPSDVLVETRVNGALRQSGMTSLMIYPPAFLVRWISRMMTLMPGDIIATVHPQASDRSLPATRSRSALPVLACLRNPVHAPASVVSRKPGVSVRITQQWGIGECG